MTEHSGEGGGDRRGRTSSGGQPAAGAGRSLSELARAMQAQADAGDLLRLIVDAAVREVEGAQHAGVMLLSRGGVTTAARTDELVERVDTAQYEAGEGPCLTALHQHVTVRANRLGEDPRWPRFGATAARLGVGSMLSVQLFVRGDDLGALD